MTAAKRYARGIAQDPENRERDDFYPTPPAATRALLTVEQFPGTIWEPACGDGAISRVLIDSGHEVVSTDLIDRGYGLGGVDFLLDYTLRPAHVVTNPPFKLAREFIDHALARADHKVAMFLRLAFLEGQKRGAMFQSTPLARVWVFSDRINFKRGGTDGGGGGSGMISFAWFVWDHLHEGPPNLGWLNTKELTHVDSRED